MLDLVWPPLAAFLLAVALTYLVRPIALMAGVVAVPKEDRWHRGRIPLLGGVAIVGAVLIVAALLPPLPVQAWTLVGGASVLALAGLVDDLRPLNPQAKFLVQLVITSVLVTAGLRLSITGYAALDQIITLVWLVGVSNAFNLLDNMDGLAAGIGLIAAAFRCYFFLRGRQPGRRLAGRRPGRRPGRVPALQLPAGVGVHGRHRQPLHRADGRRPERDGAVSVQPRHGGGAAAAGAPAARAALRHRLCHRGPDLAGRSVAQGGRDHTSHRLVALGLSERGAVLALWAMALVSGVVGLLSYRYGLPYTATLVGLLLAGFVVLAAKLGLQRVYPERHPASGMVRVVADFQFKKQVATVALDAALVALAYYSAYLLRFEGALDAELPLFANSLLIVLPCHVLMLGLFKTYQDSWRHGGLRDLLSLVGAATAGVALSMLVVLAALPLRELLAGGVRDPLAAGGAFLPPAGCCFGPSVSCCRARGATARARSSTGPAPAA